jgi:hypothetical protein
MHSRGNGGGGALGPWDVAHALRPRSASATIPHTGRHPLLVTMTGPSATDQAVRAHGGSAAGGFLLWPGAPLA